MGEFVLVRVGQFRAAEGCAVNAVAAGSAANDDDHIARLYSLLDAIARDCADAAAEDQRIPQISRVKPHRAVDGWDAHAVAIVAYAGGDAPKDRARMNDALGYRVHRPVGVCDTEDVGIGNGLGAEAAAEDVADDTADAGGGAAVRLDG